MIGSKQIHLQTIDSTNNYLKKLMESEKIDNGTLVVADEQTEGRGQRENQWESNKSENLTFSFILFPNKLQAIDQFMLSKFVSLALCDLLSIYTPDVRIKWPNDIYIKDKKTAGILIENVIKGQLISSTVIGIGLNINQMNFSENLSSATSLSIETNVKYELDIILNQLINFLNIRYNELNEGHWDKIDNSYLNVVYKFREYAYYQANGKIFEAKIVHIEKDGRIALLTKKNELLYFAFKEVHFINSSTG